MIKYDYKIRIPYVHVDRMGFVYHSHYIEYFDMARNEMMRSLGLSNKQLEDEGIMLPVINVDIKYNMPAHYDDMLTVRVQLLELPGVMITFNYDVLR
ncbi:MAG: thioesterase family protein, partial [Rikenellaceae bacterium]